MEKSSIFIGSPYKSSERNLKNSFKISIYELFFQICISFVPPIFKRFQRIPTDFSGPVIAIATFTCILQYGHSNKTDIISLSPIKFSIGYGIVMPILCKLLLNIGKSCITFYEILSLLGYALYGHILSLGLSFILFDEASNQFFFLCLIVFSGFSTFHLAVILLKSIPKPAAALLICSAICIIQVLSLVFVHFAYMHKTYVYRQKL